MSTESELRDWRYGTTQAERLCAALLAVQEFADIDPQAPLGGPDGTKDILCTKNGIEYVAAAYFPTTNKKFDAVKSKFLGDLKGVSKHKRDGFIFFTNQHLTIGERKKLHNATDRTLRDCQIFHLEKIRTTLDQPSGYGVRAEFLRIPLSPEEQFAYFANSRDGVERRMAHQSGTLQSINSKLDALVQKQDYVVQTMVRFGAQSGIDSGPPPSNPDLYFGGLYNASKQHNVGVSKISVDLLLTLHRAICSDLPSRSVGCLREQEVFLAHSGKLPSQAVATPPNASEVPTLLANICTKWATGYSELKIGTDEEKLDAIASFHAEFLQTHPFLDGNGRVARFIVMQQCLDLFGVADMGVFDKGAEYYAALQSADNGDLVYLTRLLAPIVGHEI